MFRLKTFTALATTLVATAALAAPAIAQDQPGEGKTINMARAT